MANIIGPDISSFENDPNKPEGIDFVKMRQLTNFVLIRAGDANFNINWSGARKAGLARGSFWFYDSRQDPIQEANLWFTQLGGDLGELPLFMDLEETFHGAFDGWHKWLLFLERLKTLVGKKEIGIYSSFFYWRDNGPSIVSDPDKLEYFHQYPLWIAHYNVDRPKVPKPWGEDEWLFWQFEANGDAKQYGAQSKSVDLNYFHGDGQKLAQRFNLPPSTDPPPVAPPPLQNPAQVIAELLNMRSGPDKSHGVIGFLRQAEVVDSLASSPDGSWIQVRRNDGLSGWCAGRYLKALGTSTRPPPVQPPSPPPNTNGQLRVVATLLNIREGPGKNFQVLGFLRQDDAVDVLATSSDQSWIQIRRNDNLTGWCAGQYLRKM